MEQELRFAVVEIHDSPWAAHVSRALLQSEGIPAFLASEHHIWAQWPMSLVLGGVRLLVPLEHGESAKRVIALRDSGELEAALIAQMDSGVVACSRCGSAAFRETRDWFSIAVSSMLLFAGSIIFPPSKVRQCASCGAAAGDEPGSGTIHGSRRPLSGAQ
jgi:hypothetical protein